VNPEGCGAGGNFANGLLGGKSDDDPVVALILPKGLAGLDSADGAEKVPAGAVDVAILEKGFVVPPAEDPNEKAGAAPEEKLELLKPPNSPPPLDAAGWAFPVPDPPFTPF
jgi:hypothetical protein